MSGPFLERNEVATVNNVKRHFIHWFVPCAKSHYYSALTHSFVGSVLGIDYSCSISRHKRIWCFNNRYCLFITEEPLSYRVQKSRCKGIIVDVVDACDVVSWVASA